MQRDTNTRKSQKHRNENKGKVYTVVGHIDVVKIHELLGIVFPDSEVRMYPGTDKHIEDEHGDIYQRYSHLLSEFIANPDYIGQNPTKPNSVELYKRTDDDILIAIKLDPTGYVFLSSMYDMRNGEYKIKSRLRSGRIVPYNQPNV